MLYLRLSEFCTKKLQILHNMCAKHYENLTMFSRVTANNVWAVF